MTRHVKTVLRVIAGFVLLIVGALLSLPGVPGPGIVIIILGLWLLSAHFEWARKALAWAKEKAERLKERARQARGRAAVDPSSDGRGAAAGADTTESHSGAGIDTTKPRT